MSAYMLIVIVVASAGGASGGVHTSMSTVPMQTEALCHAAQREMLLAEKMKLGAINVTAKCVRVQR